MRAEDLDKHTQKVLTAIGAERRRQLLEGGWTTEHDDEHTDGALAVVAAQLAVDGTDETVTTVCHPEDRFRVVRKHRKDRRRQLVIAAALLVAEIQRFDRDLLRECVFTEEEARQAVADIKHWKRKECWPGNELPAWACKVVAALQKRCKNDQERELIHHTSPEVFEVAYQAYIHYLEGELDARGGIEEKAPERLIEEAARGRGLSLRGRPDNVIG